MGQRLILVNVSMIMKTKSTRRHFLDRKEAHTMTGGSCIVFLTHHCKNKAKWPITDTRNQSNHDQKLSRSHHGHDEVVWSQKYSVSGNLGETSEKKLKMSIFVYHGLITTRDRAITDYSP